MSKTVFHSGTARVKPALARDELNEREIEQLMRVYTQDKTVIDEEDAITLLRWANRVRREAILLDMVLDGMIVPSVKDGAVYMALPGAGRQN